MIEKFPVAVLSGAWQVGKSTINQVFDIKGLLAFMEEHPDTVRGVLVHTGARVMWLHSKVTAVPWWWLDI